MPGGHVPVITAIAFILMFGSTVSLSANTKEYVSITYIDQAYAATCNIDDNLDETAEEFVGRCCKGSVKSVFPSPLWRKTLGEIKKNRSSRDQDYKTAWKLLSRQEYRK